MLKSNKKGVILLIVLGVILVVIILITVILRIIAHQSRLTHHQVSRIQAEYAAKAGLVYALDKLRRNDDTNWPAAGTYTKCMARTGWVVVSPCTTLDITENDLPRSIDHIEIFVNDLGTGIDGTREIRSTAFYTYTP